MHNIPYTNWIWLGDWNELVKDECHLVYFRKEVFLEEAASEETAQEAVIRISADSRYKLYVNEELVSVGPSRGDRQIWYYDEVNVRPYLVSGQNVISVEVLRYPLSHQKGNHGIFRTETPGLYLKEVVRESAEGSCRTLGLSADSSWKCRAEANFKIHTESPFFAPLQILEERYGQEADAGWKKPGFHDSDWENAVAYHAGLIHTAVSPGNLQARTIPPMRLEDRRFKGLFGSSKTQAAADAWESMLAGTAEVRIAPNSREVIEIDAGELNTGYLSLRLKGGRNAAVKILTSEGYVKKEDNKKASHLPKKGDRCDWENGYLDGFTDTYNVGGYGTETQPETYEPFWFRTFRFVQITIETQDDPAVIEGFDYKETGYPLEPKTWVETSDESMKPIWEISLRTLKRCMHETYEDCPFYEQLQYAMDSRSQILYTYMVSGDDRLARKCMDDFRRSQRYDGMINASYPCYGPNVIPGFSIYYIMMVYDHMMYFGDKELLRFHMSTIDGILEYFNHNLDERGLVRKIGDAIGRAPYWSFIDWVPQWDENTGVPTASHKGSLTMESLLYIMGLQHAADILEYLGRKENAQEYRERACGVQKSVNTYCRDKDGIYVDGPGVMEYSQHCQVFAVLTDTALAEQGRSLLLDTLRNKEHYGQCSVAMAYYLFRALDKAGIYEETKDLWDLWRNMIKNNLTTCVEDGVNERSDCHAWGALALYELPAVVLGVQPLEPGFKKIGVRPVAGYLTWARGEVVTAQGIVKVEWQKQEDGEVKVKYEINRQ